MCKIFYIPTPATSVDFSFLIMRTIKKCPYITSTEVKNVTRFKRDSGLEKVVI